MEPEVEALARRVGRRLTSQFGDDLPLRVEAELQGGPAAPRQFDIGTAVAVVNLIINIARFAWDIWKDRRSGQSPSRDVIARRIKSEGPWPAGATQAQRDQITAAVVDELPLT
jgi:hypothetical protein